MDNITLFQFFHWYNCVEDELWTKAKKEAPQLRKHGVTHIWLPPAYKSAYGGAEPGYAVYDLYDLGEFNQKNTIRTKYGTKDEYLSCIKALQENGIDVLADIVLNHKVGGDEQEKVPVKRVDPQDRTKISDEEESVDAWTKFYFPGRKGKYSSYTWDWHSFTGVSEDNENIFLILNEHADGTWEDLIEDEMGNYDYLMGADIEFRNRHVVDELKYWGEWYVESTGINGFRLDAVKHIRPDFFNEWLEHLKSHFERDFFCVGEYWRSSPEPLIKYIEVTGEKIQLFDVPLHFNFHRASVSGNEFDMRTILDNTLLKEKPLLTVTFVENHDTQPLQSLQSPVDTWFKPLAYALILLREQGIPCVFYPEFYGATYVERKEEHDIKVEIPVVPTLREMMWARKAISYGMQRDYFDHGNTIGWTREGVDDREFSGVAVVLTNGAAGDKDMEVGKKHAGKYFVDISGGCGDRVLINEDGFGHFLVCERWAAVWIREEAAELFKSDNQ